MVVHNPKHDFFTKVDTFLSSILCNCFQVSCMIPNRSLYCTYNSTGTSSSTSSSSSSSNRGDTNTDTNNITSQWMNLLVQESMKNQDQNNPPPPTFTLRDMVLPGSHDSGSSTISIWKPYSAAGRTQNISLYEQLMAGIRYLDIRVANGSTGDDTVLSIWHGCLEGDNFTNAIQGIADYIQNGHPNEIIVCEIVPEYNKKFNPQQKHNCLTILQQILGEYIIPSNQMHDVIENTPFVQVIHSMKQRIIILLHDRFFEGNDAIGMSVEDIATQFNFHKSNDYIRNPWNNTRDCTELMEKNLQSVQQFTNFRGKLLSNQFVCTPGIGGNGIQGIIGLFTGTNSLRPVSYACRLYGPNMLDQFLCHHADMKWNIIALDFIDLCPDIIDYTIALNWSHVTTMKVLLATTNSNGTNTDVTTKIQSYLFRNTVIFLPDPIANFGIQAESCNLTIAYSLLTTGTTKSAYCVITVDINGDTPIIISPFGYNEGSKHVCITEDNGSTGIVYCGKIYTTKAELPKNDDTHDGAIIEYNIENAHCQFNIV
jgi:hypothetical protein